ncbi:MAG: RIP metalloprotease RseP [Paraprevotella sp.]|nr:RIP metalloprotease RseP [Paraprevotella sp.]
MDAIIIKALQLVLSLSILVVLHEGGHFFFSKLFHVKVEKFFLFFDPYFHLFSTKDKWFTRLFPKCKNNETEYGIGWLPFGGYVKIAGMINESLDTEQMKRPVQSWEFRAKPAWQRLFIMIGGVVVNFLLALFIYVMVLFVWGEQYIPMKDMKLGFQFNEQAEKIGFRDGDILYAVDGKELKKWNGSIYRDISKAHEVTLRRGGTEMTLTMPKDMNMLEMLKSNPPFMVPVVPSVVDSVMAGTPAEKAGMSKGDRIVAMDGKPMSTWTDFDIIMQKRMDKLAAGCSHEDSVKLRRLTLVCQKGGAGQTDTLSLELTPDYKMGVVRQSLADCYKPVQMDYGFLASIPAGVSHGVDVLSGYVSDLKYLFTADGAKSVGSFITIGNIFPSTWNWLAFWETTAFLSLMLAFMNILPIPALDGGHVLFLVAEMILRRPPSDKFLERAQMVGMVLIMGLMVLACHNDIVRFLL